RRIAPPPTPATRPRWRRSPCCPMWSRSSHFLSYSSRSARQQSHRAARINTPARVQPPRPGLEPGGPQAGVDRHLDLVGDLERTEHGGVRLHAPGALFDHCGAAEVTVVADLKVKGHRVVAAGQLQIPLDPEPPLADRP